MSDLFEKIGERLINEVKQPVLVPAGQIIFFLKDAEEGVGAGAEVGEGEFVEQIADDFVQIQSNGDVLGYPVESIADDEKLSIVPASKIFASIEECQEAYPEVFALKEQKVSDNLSVVGKRTAWIINDDTEKELTSHNLQKQVVSFVRNFLSNYDIGAQYDLKFYTVRNGSYKERNVIESGDISLGLNLRTISNVKIKTDVTVPIRGGKMIEPSVLFLNGGPRIICQSTFDRLIKDNTFSHPMYGNPERFVTPEILKMYQRTRIPRINPGVYGRE
jgi:hypothetical protein